MGDPDLELRIRRLHSQTRAAVTRARRAGGLPISTTPPEPIGISSDGRRVIVHYAAPELTDYTLERDDFSHVTGGVA